MKTLPLLCLATAFLAGCGNLAAVKSFNTPYASPASGDTARLRVTANGMVRAVPGLGCVDWYSPGAGVVVSAQDGFADRNGETLGMPPAVTTRNGTVSEVLIPAGKPFTLHFMDGGTRTSYDRVQNCIAMLQFTPKAGADYEFVAKGYSACVVDLSRLERGKLEAVKVQKAEYCSKWANF